MIVQSLGGEWQFRQSGTDAWLPARVPGGVHTDLMALDTIPDPFEADNELRVQWVAEADWEYRLVFHAEAALTEEERVFLVCDGLDTLARVTLNGDVIGASSNMFLSHRWDVTGRLLSGRNELRIYFASPVAYVQARQKERPLPSPTPCIQGGPHLRKTPSHFGWDWGPQLPPIGIWKDIRLEGASTARLAEVHVYQRHKGGVVSIHADVEVEHWAGADLQVVFRVFSPHGERSETEAELGEGETRISLTLPVAEPRLWWPNGYGEQPLYDADVSLRERGHRLDVRRYRMGLRTVELRQAPDAHGTSFEFIVNGVPVFAKGANWIPADSFPTRISDQQLEHLIRSAAEANMNMLRVWGGGIYEDETFYDLCDQYGVLVWQDFVFSCAIYPGDAAFLDSVREEAIQNVRRLRHRTSLALWCGNNEMEWGWVEWGWNQPIRLGLKKVYDDVFHHLLPQICEAEDPGRPYWPSSPSSGVPFEDPNGVLAGDTHNWEVWHRNVPFTAYRDHPSRFVSEFGFQSLPAAATIRSYAAEGERNMTSFVIEHHQRSGSGNGKMITYLTDHFRMPKDFESLVYLTQLLQAEAMRVGVEHWRRDRQRTSGALYWQLNDCWPVASWSSIDYYGRWKALHYVARRFFSPVLLSAKDVDDQVALFVTNDGIEPWEGRVRWSLETLDGGVIRDGVESVVAPPLQALEVRELDFTGLVGRATGRRRVLVHELLHGDERAALGVVTFAPSKHLELVDPHLRVDVRAAPAGYEIDLAAESLARFVWLELEGHDGVFGDNCFDLPAGRTVTVTLPHLGGLEPEQVSASLRVRSLFDTF